MPPRTSTVHSGEDGSAEWVGASRPYSCDGTGAGGHRGAHGWRGLPSRGSRQLEPTQGGPGDRPWHTWSPGQLGPSPRGPMGGTGRALLVSQPPRPRKLLTDGKTSPTGTRAVPKVTCKSGPPRGPCVPGQGLGRASPGARGLRKLWQAAPSPGVAGLTLGPGGDFLLGDSVGRVWATLVACYRWHLPSTQSLKGRDASPKQRPGPALVLLLADGLSQGRPPHGTGTAGCLSPQGGAGHSDTACRGGLSSPRAPTWPPTEGQREWQPRGRGQALGHETPPGQA